MRSMYNRHMPNLKKKYNLRQMYQILLIVNVHFLRFYQTRFEKRLIQSLLNVDILNDILEEVKVQRWGNETTV